MYPEIGANWANGATSGLTVRVPPGAIDKQPLGIPGAILLRFLTRRKD